MPVEKDLALHHPTPNPDRPAYAALTGDLVRSTKLSAAALDAARRVVADAVADIDRAVGRNGASPAEFFRGDAWQVVLAEPACALRTALLIRARLRAIADVDTRISIGVGPVETIDRHRASLSTGEAFVLSGRKLDTMTSYFDLTGDLPAAASALQPWFTLTLQLCGGLARSWTRRQAEMVARALVMRDATHEAIGRSLDPAIRKQSVTGVLEAAHWRLLSEALMVFEQTDWRAVVNGR